MTGPRALSLLAELLALAGAANAQVLEKIPEVELERNQTIMQGAAYCDFRHRMKTAGSST